uniref:Uncharacterized protein n=1 Tax=Moniliophthora roreri TaxID=221103 RepID=A0A0W0FTW8_MONRR
MRDLFDWTSPTEKIRHSSEDRLLS